MSLTLVIGGARSGKSAHAERLALALALSGDGSPVRYVATADGDDASMAARIAAHVARRPASWETVTAGNDLAAAIAVEGVSLIDGLGVWLGGALHRGVVDVPAQIARETASSGTRRSRGPGSTPWATPCSACPPPPTGSIT